jgi:hypothetical protein
MIDTERILGASPEVFALKGRYRSIVRRLDVASRNFRRRSGRQPGSLHRIAPLRAGWIVHDLA